MMTEAQIEEALFPWRAVANAMDNNRELYDDYSRGLAEGYASALEMVLRGVDLKAGEDVSIPYLDN